MNNTELGRVGETLAVDYLTRKGFTVVGRNVRVGHFEIDIICENETHLLFVEVKARTGASLKRYGRPASAIDETKKQHLRDGTNAYLRLHPTAKKLRVDAVEVYLNRKGSFLTLAPQGIKHIENILI